MVTLTYRDGVEWVASHVRDFLQRCRVYAKRSGFVLRYVWVMELTKRGRPHYHMLVWLPKGRTLPKPDKRGWWTHGMTKIEWARRAVGYLAKYASKLGDVPGMFFPAGARIHGNGGLDHAARVEVRWWKLPTWVRDVWPQICDVGRISGGYVQRETGEFLRSPWHVYIDGSGRVFCWSDQT